MTDEVVRLKAEVRELQEALAAERAKPAQVPDPKVVAENERLRRRVNELTAGRCDTQNTLEE